LTVRELHGAGWPRSRNSLILRELRKLIRDVKENLATLAEGARAQHRATDDALMAFGHSTLEGHRLLGRAREAHAGLCAYLPVTAQGRRVLRVVNDSILV
jgi:uncharacterized membrane protein